jgi:flavin-dependent dehydrogenase
MKKLYYVRTNGYDMVVFEDGDVIKVLTQCAGFPKITWEDDIDNPNIKAFLDGVKEDLDFILWEEVETTIEDLMADSAMLYEMEL